MRCLVRICANDFSLTVPCPQCRTAIEKSELGFPSVPLEVQFSCTAAYDIAMNDVVTAENPFQGIFERMIERHEADSYVGRARRGPPQFDENVVAVEPEIQAVAEEEISAHSFVSEGILTPWKCEECETDEVDMISRDPRYCMSCCYNING